MLKLNDFSGMKVTVMGLGLNGGGLASALFCATQGADVTVTDMKSQKDLIPSVEKLNSFDNIRFVLGKHEIADFENADLVIKNPAVKRAGNKFLAKAKKIESDISIFLQLTSAPILAVTGSKGKSSTVSALHYGLTHCGYNAFLGGNITVSPLTFLKKTDATTPVVLELSSWQLNDLQNSQLSPEVVILTPIMSDHQNWYGSMASYVADKKIIYKNQKAGQFTVCNADDEWGKVFASETAAKVLWYSKEPFSDEKKKGVYFTASGDGVCNIDNNEILLLPSDCKVPGRALRQNVLNAGLAMFLFGVDAKKIPSVMKNYSGLEHRLEFFHENQYFRFYNDTTATVPEAVVAALDSFSTPPVLIAGGTDKNLDFTSLAENADKAEAVFLLEGSGTDLLVPMLQKRNIVFEGVFSNLEDLLEALNGKDCLKNSKRKNVIFSPGATSFGMFQNEFDRGNKFKEIVKDMFR
ncbi:MAG: UDP-N-acetylmuramoyl-L-alanine--D-glutamate ligase [Treponema sp.]|nr:MAG: UDP-N-acetylmuramoyl-L-alanine--D-glutamate ligase [Treponema sp.]